MGGELTVGGAVGVFGRVLACLDVAKHLTSHVFCHVEPGQDTTKYAFCATDGQLAAHGFVDAFAAYAWVCCCSGAGLRRISEKITITQAGLERAQNSYGLILVHYATAKCWRALLYFLKSIGTLRLASNTLSLTTGFRGRKQLRWRGRASRDAHWAKEELPSVGRGPLLC